MAWAKRMGAAAGYLLPLTAAGNLFLAYALGRRLAARALRATAAANDGEARNAAKRLETAGC